MKHYQIIKDPERPRQFIIQVKNWMFGKYAVVEDHYRYMQTGKHYPKRFPTATAAKNFILKCLNADEKHIKIKDYSAAELKRIADKQKEQYTRTKIHQNIQ